MEEITIVLSSLAGACTAVALDKIPKRRQIKQAVGINSAIKSQLHSLGIEKEILSKTITRLYQEESHLSKVQRDKLLIRYQHQLGTVIAKIDKLEMASKYPDLGPIGDTLITLMDSKLSQLDQRLHEIYSKISLRPSSSSTIPQENSKEIIEVRPATKKAELGTDIQDEKSEIQKERIQTMHPIEIPPSERHRSVELSTLTEIPSKMPEFPSELIKIPQGETKQKEQESLKKEILTEKSPIVTIDSPLAAQKEERQVIETAKLQTITQEPEKKVQLPSPLKIPEEEKIEDDDKDLDKIKSEIMKALSKLEQVEVE